MIKHENIINFDIQGWPVYKKSLGDIIKQICNYDKENKRFWIDENDPKLEIFPLVLEDDGMGYGINEKNIIEFSVHDKPDSRTDKIFSTMFVETPLPSEKIDMWIDLGFYPSAFVKIRGRGRKRYILRDIRKTSEGKFEVFAEYYPSRKLKDNETKEEWITVTKNDLDWD